MGHYEPDNLKMYLKAICKGATACKYLSWRLIKNPGQGPKLSHCDHFEISLLQLQVIPLTRNLSPMGHAGRLILLKQAPHNTTRNQHNTTYIRFTMAYFFDHELRRHCTAILRNVCDRQCSWQPCTVI